MNAHPNKSKEVKFFPFHAINEFMLDDYRAQVIRQVLHSLEALPEDRRAALERLIKGSVKIPGFRNSLKAPEPLKLKLTIEAFQKNPALVAAVLAAWAELHPALRQQTYDMLAARGWELLPIDADRTRLPGWLTTWPQGEEYDVLYQSFNQAYPDTPVEKNDLSLMVVWLATRLPYEFVEWHPHAPDQPADQNSSQ